MTIFLELFFLLVEFALFENIKVLGILVDLHVSVAGDLNLVMQGKAVSCHAV